MEIVSAIKDLCRKHGTSMARLERELGFAAGSICKWDSKIPSVERIARVADYFGVTLDAIIGRGQSLESLTGIQEVYLSLARSAQEKGIDAADLEILMEAARSIQNRKNEQ
ncbi:MAG: helix-turn-helix transcriptional regulator [Clostridia bacterium]|nr:helix-turn-helix transcriptional regulator [Oscillospiraceae bacterium]MBR6748313.1 helix-turn-helix transcriptional regulator [Clostridia bacterium]